MLKNTSKSLNEDFELVYDKKNSKKYAQDDNFNRHNTLLTVRRDQSISGQTHFLPEYTHAEYIETRSNSIDYKFKLIPEDIKLSDFNRKINVAFNKFEDKKRHETAKEKARAIKADKLELKKAAEISASEEKAKQIALIAKRNQQKSENLRKAAFSTAFKKVRNLETNMRNTLFSERNIFIENCEPLTIGIHLAKISVKITLQYEKYQTELSNLINKLISIAADTKVEKGLQNAAGSTYLALSAFKEILDNIIQRKTIHAMVIFIYFLSKNFCTDWAELEKKADYITLKKNIPSINTFLVFLKKILCEFKMNYENFNIIWEPFGKMFLCTIRKFHISKKNNNLKQSTEKMITEFLSQLCLTTNKLVVNIVNDAACSEADLAACEDSKLAFATLFKPNNSSDCLKLFMIKMLDSGIRSESEHLIELLNRFITLCRKKILPPSSTPFN